MAFRNIDKVRIRILIMLEYLSNETPAANAMEILYVPTISTMTKDQITRTSIQIIPL